jgi:hypothetical protein
MQKPHIQQAHLLRKEEDDWTGITAREERKKRQNRLNQRARRLRNQKTKDDLLPGKRPFRVQRWRIGAGATEHPRADRESSESSTTAPIPLDHDNLDFIEFVKLKNPSFLQLEPIFRDRCNNRESSASSTRLPIPLDLDNTDFIELVKHDKDSILQLEPIFRHGRTSTSPKYFNPSTHPISSQTSFPVIDFPLSPDHLLIHLIHYNVFRGLTANKALLNSKATLTKPTDQGILPLLPSFTQFCNGLTIIEPHKEAVLPPCLYPSSLQMTHPHSSWINMFPFPRFRKNLIEFEGVFDAHDLCNDLFGDIFTGSAVMCSESSVALTPKTFEECSDSDEETIAAGRRGLIAWGEPWDINGWEPTPGFVKKWAWLLNGCNDMIESGNRWRVKRNEEPLPLILG